MVGSSLICAGALLIICSFQVYSSSVTSEYAMLDFPDLIM